MEFLGSFIGRITGWDYSLPRLLGTGHDSFPSSGSSHYYPFGCQFKIEWVNSPIPFLAALAIRDCRLLTTFVCKVRNRSYLWLTYIHN